jgi:hypothetical protein
LLLFPAVSHAAVFWWGERPREPGRGGEEGLWTTARGDARPTVVEISNPATGQMSVQTVERLPRLLGGDPHVEGMVLQFIANRYGAKDLFHLPPQVAKEIMRRPADFIQVVKEHYEPELRF